MTATETVDQASVPKAYGDFAGQLTWDLHELESRTRSAMTTLHSAQEIDTDKGAGLTLSYLLQGIANRIEELAVRLSNTEFQYVANEKFSKRAAE